MKVTYLSLVYEYLMANNLLHVFLRNHTSFPNIHDSTKRFKEPISYAFVWRRTPEGFDFWDNHNNILSSKLVDISSGITLKELIEHLSELSQEQPYEFW